MFVTAPAAPRYAAGSHGSAAIDRFAPALPQKDGGKEREREAIDLRIAVRFSPQLWVSCILRTFET